MSALSDCRVCLSHQPSSARYPSGLRRRGAWTRAGGVIGFISLAIILLPPAWSGPTSASTLRRLIQFAINEPQVRILLTEFEETRAIYSRISLLSEESVVRSELSRLLQEFTQPSTETARNTGATALLRSSTEEAGALRAEINRPLPNIAQELRNIERATGVRPNFGWESTDSIDFFSRVQLVHRRTSTDVHFDVGKLSTSRRPALQSLLSEISAAGGEVRLLGTLRPVVGNATTRFEAIGSGIAEFELRGWQPIIRIGAECEDEVLVHELTHFRDWMSVVRSKLRRIGVSSEAAATADQLERARSLALRYWNSAEGTQWTERNAIIAQLQYVRRHQPAASGRQTPELFRFENRSLPMMVNYSDAEALRQLLSQYSLSRLLNDARVSGRHELALRLASSIVRRTLVLDRARFYLRNSKGTRRLREFIERDEEAFFAHALGEGEISRFTAAGTDDSLRELLRWVLSEQIRALPSHRPEDDAFRHLLRQTLIERSH